MTGNRRFIPASQKLLVLHMARQGASRREIEDLTGVGTRTQTRVRSLFNRTGKVESRPIDCGRPRILDRDDCDFIEACISRKRDIMLSELQLELYMAKGVEVSISTISKTLEREGYTYKQTTRPAVERNEQDRSEYKELISRYYHPRQLVFADESHCNRLTSRRSHGWALESQRARRREFFTRGKRYSVLPALSLDGILHLDISEDPFTARTFNSFVEGLLPKMNAFPGPNSVLIVDNASIHHAEELRAMIEAHGVRLVYLPAYSPDLNPIEEAFSSMKAYLRSMRDFYHREIHNEAGAEPYRMLWEAVFSITPAKAEGWFRHAGYVP